MLKYASVFLHLSRTSAYQRSGAISRKLKGFKGRSLNSGSGMHWKFKGIVDDAGGVYNAHGAWSGQVKIWYKTLNPMRHAPCNPGAANWTFK